MHLKKQTHQSKFRVTCLLQLYVILLNYLLLFERETCFYSIFRDYWETITGYVAFYAAILFTFFAFLLPWTVLILGGVDPFTWLWTYLTKDQIRVRLSMKLSLIENRLLIMRSYRDLGDGGAVLQVEIRFRLEFNSYFLF